MRSMTPNFSAVPALAPAVQSASINGAAIDLKGAGRAAFVLNTGAIAGAGDFSAKIQESDDGSTFADADSAVVDTNAPATLAAASTYKFGYRGFKRYARVALTKAGGTGIAAGAVALLSDLASRPAS